MGWIRTVWNEVFGLFVDDGSYALAILAWIVVAGFALPRLGLGGTWSGLVLFAGFAAILVDSATRRARK